MKFRKKPVVIEAFRTDWVMEDWPGWVWANPSIKKWHSDWENGKSGSGIIIETLEGNMLAKFGDWIIKGVKGELYPCKPDIFEATYERVEE